MFFEVGAKQLAPSRHLPAQSLWRRSDVIVWTYLTLCSNVPIVNFEYEFAGWVGLLNIVFTRSITLGAHIIF